MEKNAKKDSCKTFNVTTAVLYLLQIQMESIIIFVIIRLVLFVFEKGFVSNADSDDCYYKPNDFG